MKNMLTTYQMNQKSISFTWAEEGRLVFIEPRRAASTNKAVTEPMNLWGVTVYSFKHKTQLSPIQTWPLLQSFYVIFTMYHLLRSIKPRLVWKNNLKSKSLWLVPHLGSELV